MEETNKNKNENQIGSVTFGGAAISGDGGGYGFGNIKENYARDLILYAFDHGIKTYDTAPIYGFGKSEKILGDVFKSRQEDIQIISKGGVSWHPNKRVNMTNEPKVMEKMLHDSLKNLGFDYIDYYLIHWPDEKVDIRYPMEVLSKAKHQGKIKHIGLSNTNVEDIKLASEVDQIEMIQGEFNIFSYNKNLELHDYVLNNNLPFLSWGTLDKGILTGSVDENRTFDDPHDARSWAPWWKKEKNKRSKKFEAMEDIRHECKMSNLTLLENAIGYNLSKKFITSVICGTKTPDQLKEVIQGSRVKMSKTHIDKMENIASKLNL